MSGAVDGAIGGAVSAVVAPVVRDALYDGTETVTTGTNAAGSPVQITSYNNANINAVTTAIAALAGGAAAGALGQNATAGVTWAANEAINNADSTKEKPDVFCMSPCTSSGDGSTGTSTGQQTSGSNTEANTADKAGKAVLSDLGIQLTPGSVDASSDGSSGSGSSGNAQNALSAYIDATNQTLVDQAAAQGKSLSPTIANAAALNLLNTDATAVNLTAGDVINSFLAGPINSIANGLISAGNLFMTLGDVTGTATPFPHVQLITPLSQYFASQGDAAAQGIGLATGATGIGRGVACPA